MLAKQAWKLDPALRHGWRLAPHPDLAIAALALAPLERAKAAQRLTSANPDHV